MDWKRLKHRCKQSVTCGISEDEDAYGPDKVPRDEQVAGQHSEDGTEQPSDSNNIEQTWGICDWPWRITRSTKDSKCKDFICDYVTKLLSSFSVLIFKLFFITVVLFYFLLFGLFSNISLLSLHILFWYGMSLVVHSHTLLF